VGGVKYSTIEEWSNRIEAAEPRDTDTVGEAMRRIAKLHLEMLGELAARLAGRSARAASWPRCAWRVAEKRADGTIPVTITLDPIAYGLTVDARCSRMKRESGWETWRNAKASIGGCIGCGARAGAGKRCGTCADKHARRERDRRRRRRLESRDARAARQAPPTH
jgi:hypothetical protein